MPAPGQVVLFLFPKADATPGKLRPALLLGMLPGRHGDWLVCMVSSQFHQFVDGFDEIVSEDSEDYQSSGLKMPSVLRIGRLAVMEGSVFVGSIGEIASSRLERIKIRLSDWLMQR